jgi:hypothetical protein
LSTRRIVGVSHRSVAVEIFGPAFIERSIETDTLCKIGICNVGATEHNQIAGTLRDQARAVRRVDANIESKYSRVKVTEMVNNRITAHMLDRRSREISHLSHQQHVPELVAGYFLVNILACFEGFVCCAEASNLAHHRPCFHPDTMARPDFKDSFEYLKEKASAVLNRPAISIGAAVRDLVKELLEEINVATLNLDTIEACVFCEFRSMLEIRHGLACILKAHLLGDFAYRPPALDVDELLRIDRRRSAGSTPILIQRVM